MNKKRKSTISGRNCGVQLSENKVFITCYIGNVRSANVKQCCTVAARVYRVFCTDVGFLDGC